MSVRASAFEETPEIPSSFVTVTVLGTESRPVLRIKSGKVYSSEGRIMEIEGSEENCRSIEEVREKIGGLLQRGLPVAIFPAGKSSLSAQELGYGSMYIGLNKP